MVNIKNYKQLFISLIFAFVVIQSYCQSDTNKFRMKLAIGLKNLIENGENNRYYRQSLNFPTINIGFQYMFISALGRNFDIGFNRDQSADKSLEFKLNYTRLNLQMGYDLTMAINFLPEHLLIQAHAKPGLIILKPLANYYNNNYTI